MKQCRLKKIGKCIISFMLAFLALNVMMRFYYYIPWNVTCADRATDFKFPANFRSFHADEGICFLQLDSNGYNNRTIPGRVDVLCMGTSNTMGYNVSPGLSWPAIPESRTDGTRKYYNIGVYGHTMMVTADNKHDITETVNLLREDDEVVFGDSGYQGIRK